jgi:hypothetical protein
VRTCATSNGRDDTASSRLMQRITRALYIKQARRIGFILATMLLVNSSLGALAIAQQDEVIALDKRVGRASI